MGSEVAHHHADNGEHEHTHTHLHPPQPLPSKHLDASADIESFNDDSNHSQDLSADAERSIADNQVLFDEVTSLRDAHTAIQHTSERDASADIESFNGDPPHASNHPQDLSADIERSIADNQVLLDEITSLRDARTAIQHTSELLQRKLNGSLTNVSALMSEVSSLEVEKKQHEDLAACAVQEVHALQAEKRDLLAENGNIASETESLHAILEDVKGKSSVIAKDVEEKLMAMAAAQTQVHLLCFEVEKLQLENEEYSKEISLLDASNGVMDMQISQLREGEKVLSSDVERTHAAKVLAEENVSDAQTMIAALNGQISALTESGEDIKDKLCEAKDRLRHLEEQDKAMALREKEMETSILDLEGRMQEQEKEATEGHSRALELNNLKGAASERDLHVMDTPSEVQDMDVNTKQQCIQELDCLVSDLHEESASEVQEMFVNTMQQHIQKLECRVADLHEEKKVLACANGELQAELQKTQEELEAEESLEQVKEDIKRLEGSLNEADERAHHLESKATELQCRLQELMVLANRKPRLAGLAAPLIISGGTIVALGLLVYLLRSNSKLK